MKYLNFGWDVTNFIQKTHSKRGITLTYFVDPVGRLDVYQSPEG